MLVARSTNVHKLLKYSKQAVVFSALTRPQWVTIKRLFRPPAFLLRKCNAATFTVFYSCVQFSKQLHSTNSNSNNLFYADLFITSYQMFLVLFPLFTFKLLAVVTSIICWYYQLFSVVQSIIGPQTVLIWGKERISIQAMYLFRRLVRIQEIEPRKLSVPSNRNGRFSDRVGEGKKSRKVSGRLGGKGNFLSSVDRCVSDSKNAQEPARCLSDRWGRERLGVWEYWIEKEWTRIPHLSDYNVHVMDRSFIG